MANNCSLSRLHINDEATVRETLAQLKFGKSRFCVFKRASETTFELDTQASSVSRWEQLVECLPTDECRAVVCNFAYTAQSDGVTRSKSILINWVPSSAKVKEKMLSAISVKALHSVLETWGTSIFVSFDAGSVSSLEHSEVEQRILSRCTVK